ncbi:hypothetical protein FACS189472_16060 [Alphaproteobacteria bacterium]|nr:hypothetical protein FACS189472_16060 [Alphaproteobacteria bacterium]
MKKQIRVRGRFQNSGYGYSDREFHGVKKKLESDLHLISLISIAEK